MKYEDNFELQYQELGEMDNLYDGVNLSKSDIVQAEYRRVKGYEGNPDICALPRVSTVKEIQLHHNIPLSGYDEKQIPKMSTGERKFAILQLREVRLPFPFHARIDQFLNATLIMSYGKRKFGITDRPDTFEVGDEQMRGTYVLGDTGITGNTLGFSVIGTAGTGKSTAIELVTAKYPKAILHNLENGSYIQIPIIKLTAFANGNLTALYYMFAQQIDSILDSGQFHYKQIRVIANIGRMTELLIRWIKRYHIGIILIDEIQMMDFSTSNPKSIENLLTITSMTGVALGMIGTEDANLCWNSVLRLSRRTEGLMVKADAYCKQRQFFELIIKRVGHYQWLLERVALTDDVIQALYDESMGSIDMLILLWMTIQYEAISRKVEPKITAVYIRKLAKEKFGHMQELLKSSLVESEKNYLSARQSVIDTIRASAEADEQKREIERLKLESERNIRTHYDRDLQMAFVIDSIRACYDYSDLMIRKAYAKAEAEEGFITRNRREATKRVLHYLEKPTKRVKKRVSVQQEEKKDTGLSERLLNELEENMSPII